MGYFTMRWRSATGSWRSSSGEWERLSGAVVRGKSSISEKAIHPSVWVNASAWEEWLIFVGTTVRFLPK